jgi:DnaJ-class molecular chaperone
MRRTIVVRVALCLLALSAAACGKSEATPSNEPCIRCAGTGLMKLEGMDKVENCKACEGTGKTR